MRALLPIVIALGLAVAAPAPAATGSRCSDWPAPPDTFDLGARFAGLPVTNRARLCMGAPPDARQTVPARVDSVIYGTCDASPDGCGGPLEVQSWPECARNFRSLDDLGLPRLTRARSRAVAGTGRIPAARIWPGQIEVYTGATTVVVFADRDALARRAARRIARDAIAGGRLPSFARLRARAMRRAGCQ
jgi:hypothetical protein